MKLIIIGHDSWCLQIKASPSVLLCPGSVSSGAKPKICSFLHSRVHQRSEICERFSGAHKEPGGFSYTVASIIAHIWFTYPCLQALILAVTLNMLGIFFSPVS